MEVIILFSPISKSSKYVHTTLTYSYRYYRKQTLQIVYLKGNISFIIFVFVFAKLIEVKKQEQTEIRQKKNFNKVNNSQNSILLCKLFIVVFIFLFFLPVCLPLQCVLGESGLSKYYESPDFPGTHCICPAACFCISSPLVGPTSNDLLQIHDATGYGKSRGPLQTLVQHYSIAFDLVKAAKAT